MQARALAAAAFSAASFFVPLLAGAQSLTSTVSGTVVSAEGKAVARAEVRSGQRAVATDAEGRFSLACGANETSLRATHAGFTTTELVVSCPSRSVTIRLAPATLTSIGGTTVANTRVPFNTSAGSVTTVGRGRIEDQGAIQLNALLDQTPGAVSAHTGSSNPAAPGAQTSPNLRGTLDYEKTTLIDGHPIANGSHGDYVTTFLTTYMLDSVEIAKGPGADAPVVVNGIGGSINFRTRNPSLRPTSEFDVTSDGYGGTVTDLMASNTFGRLGLLFDVVDYETPGPFTQTRRRSRFRAGRRSPGSARSRERPPGAHPRGPPPARSPSRARWEIPPTPTPR